MKLLQTHYMKLGKQCSAITSEFNETSKDSITRFIASMIQPDISKIMETRKQINSMSDSWFSQVISKSLKFI